MAYKEKKYKNEVLFSREYDRMTMERDDFNRRVFLNMVVKIIQEMEWEDLRKLFNLQLLDPEDPGSKEILLNGDLMCMDHPDLSELRLLRKMNSIKFKASITL